MRIEYDSSDDTLILDGVRWNAQLLRELGSPRDVPSLWFRVSGPRGNGPVILQALEPMPYSWPMIAATLAQGDRDYMESHNEWRLRILRQLESLG